MKIPALRNPLAAPFSSTMFQSPPRQKGGAWSQGEVRLRPSRNDVGVACNDVGVACNDVGTVCNDVDAAGDDVEWRHALMNFMRLLLPSPPRPKGGAWSQGEVRLRPSRNDVGVACNDVGVACNDVDAAGDDVGCVSNDNDASQHKLHSRTLNFLFFLLLTVSPVSADPDPHWLWQDGQLSGSEERELRQLDSMQVLDADTSSHGRTLLKAALDSTGHLVRQHFDVSAHYGYAYGRVAGDSGLTLWQAMLKGKIGSHEQGEIGVGNWNAQALKIPWPMAVQLGGWSILSYDKVTVKAAVALDSGAADSLWLAGLGVHFMQNSLLELDLVRHQRTWHSIANIDTKHLQSAFWIPLQAQWHGALAQFKIDAHPTLPWLLREDFLWNSADSIPTWMQLTTRQKQSQLLAKTTLTHNDSNWETKFESRFQKTKLGKIEWYARATQTRQHPCALLRYSLFALDSSEHALQTNARLEANWGTSPLSPRLLGAVQKNIAPHLTAQAPQWECGLTHTLAKGSLLELRLVTPPDYTQTHRAWLRGIAQGPCGQKASIAFHWSLDVYPRQHTLLQAPKADLKVVWEF